MRENEYVNIMFSERVMIKVQTFLLMAEALIFVSLVWIQCFRYRAICDRSPMSRVLFAFNVFLTFGLMNLSTKCLWYFHEYAEKLRLFEHSTHKYILGKNGSWFLRGFCGPNLFVLGSTGICAVCWTILVGVQCSVHFKSGSPGSWRDGRFLGAWRLAKKAV